MILSESTLHLVSGNINASKVKVITALGEPGKTDHLFDKCDTNLLALNTVTYLLGLGIQEWWTL